ncbi:MAG TPA: ATP-binding protein [Solimonas sp.]|nr:ATP-binding protein [Solimonas sp.]
MELRKLWARRYHGWIWLIVPAVAFVVLMRVSTWIGWQPEPTPIAHALRSLIAVICGLIGAYGVWRIGEPLWQMLKVVRHLAAGRLEARLPTGWSGITAELALQVNAIGKMLAQYRDHQDQMVMQTTTRLRQDQERLQELNSSLREALQASQNAAAWQSELFSNLSHELRTPLTAILGYAELLRRSGLNSDQEKQLATLDKSARSLVHMINDLLDWSRIEAGRLRLNEETFEVLDSVEDTTALLAPLAYDKDLELVRIVYHDVPRRLEGDAQRLRQILTNLISNAIKFTERGEVVLRVMREREEEGRVWLRFAVSDTGVGISAEQQARLFQPFQQVGRMQAGGSGLGLSITRKLSELMSGRVELKSAEGQGSTFSAVLPFGLAEGPELAMPHDLRLRERGLWLLEPHPTARLATTHWLEFWGMRVKTFQTWGELADSLRHAAANLKPDVVIIGCKEHEALAPPMLEIAGLCAERTPPLLVLVASASLELRDRLRAAGAAACHPKSIGRVTLRDELSRLTSRPAAGVSPLDTRQVLIADNNLPNRRYLAALCSGLGLQVVEAADGAEALARWLERRQEFVLLDARMPNLDGPGCARGIRAAEGGTRRTRIVAVSAHLEPEQREAFLKAGADEVLLKPFDERQLLRALAPTISAQPAPVSAMLTADPQMLTLLRDELPQQVADLEEACAGNSLEAARAAAHTLRGTAAFYHLASLRQSTSALEQWLGRATVLTGNPRLVEELNAVRRAVHATLADIDAKAVGRASATS